MSHEQDQHLASFADPIDAFALAAAIAQAQKSYREGGLPIGSSLVMEGRLAAVGHNRRQQHADSIAHAELDCLRSAGPVPGALFESATLYSTLSPCWMCAGATRLYGIRRVVVADAGEDVAGQERWRADAAFFRQAGIVYDVRTDEKMVDLFRQFLRERPNQWSGDVGDRDTTC